MLRILLQLMLKTTGETLSFFTNIFVLFVLFGAASLLEAGPVQPFPDSEDYRFVCCG